MINRTGFSAPRQKSEATRDRASQRTMRKHNRKTRASHRNRTGFSAPRQKSEATRDRASKKYMFLSTVDVLIVHKSKLVQHFLYKHFYTFILFNFAMTDCSLSKINSVFCSENLDSM
ncbi:hypothetical protein [Urbanus proteus nucleopolyhedrovirus]|uniref:Uncharacterized protein n=1 Tax=Urbanus proteus nucleopolyhedrovirus TaxID=1675866 RepID=A0A162GUI9_9ABAC|nr:hypothetical protein [Urbanus proteus nucleopolyhedrovirus]AKR17347.1 hypothetical protein [Urbanus proteus nucleopolyhedrovirus]